jgi:hypothetical protein
MYLHIDRGGNVRCLYDEALDLSSLGSIEIRRASHVDPDARGQWWADMAPVGGGKLGPFATRSVALAAETAFFDQQLAAWPQC